MAVGYSQCEVCTRPESAQAVTHEVQSAEPDVSENTYQPPSVQTEPPRIDLSGSRRTFLASVQSMRTTVAVLVIALVFQWCCHLLTALAMFGWMGMVNGAPTAKSLDSVFYGFACVGITAMIAFAVGIYGAKKLTDTRNPPPT